MSNRSPIALALLLALSACSEPPAPVEDGLLFAGRVTLEDELADVRTGSVFVNVFNRRGDRIPSYCRKYDLGDPAFRATGDGLELVFAIDETHNMAGMGMPLGNDPQLEVRYDPDGAVDTKDGVRSAWTAARRGTTGLSLALDASAEAPPAASGGATSRPTLPAGHPSLEATSRPTSQPTSRPTE